MAGKKPLDAGTAKAVQTHFAAFATAGKETAEALRVWKQTVAPDCTAPRIADTVRVTEKTVSAVAAALAPLGIRIGSTP